MTSDVIQLVLAGLLLGGIYALAAFGLSISFGVLNILNLAHGEFLMLGALVGYSLFAALGLNPFASVLIVVPVFAVAGAGFYWLLLKPVSRKAGPEKLVASVLITLGAALAIEDLASFLWERPVTGIAFSMPPLEIGGVVVSSLRLMVLLTVCALAVALQIILRRTFAGKAIRGVTQCVDGARVVGIPLSRISAVTFGISAATAATAGVFYVTLFQVTPSVGIPLTVKYLCVVVLGGLGSLVGSVVGGLILGMGETLAAYFFGSQWSPCVAFGLLIAILIVKPEGLFGARG